MNTLLSGWRGLGLGAGDGGHKLPVSPRGSSSASRVTFGAEGPGWTWGWDTAEAGLASRSKASAPCGYGRSRKVLRWGILSSFRIRELWMGFLRVMGFRECSEGQELQAQIRKQARNLFLPTAESSGGPVDLRGQRRRTRAGGGGQGSIEGVTERSQR